MTPWPLGHILALQRKVHFREIAYEPQLTHNSCTILGKWNLSKQSNITATHFSIQHARLVALGLHGLGRDLMHTTLWPVKPRLKKKKCKINQWKTVVSTVWGTYHFLRKKNIVVCSNTKVHKPNITQTSWKFTFTSMLSAIKTDLQTA